MENFIFCALSLVAAHKFYKNINYVNYAKGSMLKVKLL